MEPPINDLGAIPIHSSHRVEVRVEGLNTCLESGECLVASKTKQFEFGPHYPELWVGEVLRAMCEGSPELGYVVVVQ